MLDPAPGEQGQHNHIGDRKMKAKQIMERLGACQEAVDWAGDRTPEQAWAECQRGDWMLWYASRIGTDLQTLTRAKVRCARLVEHLMTDQRSLDALDVAERFADGDATRHAADVAAYADDVAAVAADAAARSNTLAQFADICREVIPFDPIASLEQLDPDQWDEFCDGLEDDQ